MGRNKIEGPPIQKLAMVKRLKVKTNPTKKKSSNKSCQKIVKKILKKVVEKNSEKSRRKKSAKNSSKNLSKIPKDQIQTNK